MYKCHDFYQISDTLPPAKYLKSDKNLKMKLALADIGKTFGPLPDQRTGNHMENPRFTGPPKLLQDLIFFQQ